MQYAVIHLTPDKQWLGGEFLYLLYIKITGFQIFGRDFVSNMVELIWVCLHFQNDSNW